MPAIRHARRDRNPPPPAGLALPSLSALLSSSGLSTSSSSTDVDADGGNSNGTSNEKKSKGTPGFSTDTTPLFLRRSKASRVTDDVVQRGLDASRLLGSIVGSMNSGSSASPVLEGLQIVASSCALLFDTVQSVRTNKAQCLQLLERVHQIVRALINLTGDAKGLMAPMMARSIDQFIGTLTRVHALLRTQAVAGLWARIVRHAETQGQLAECAADLQQALDVFSVQTGLITNSAMGTLRKDAAAKHAELLRALGRGGS